MSLARLSRHVIAVIGIVLGSYASASTADNITVSEKTLRSFATHVVTPVFSEIAFKTHQFGVAVARVDVEPSGIPKAVTILQSPSPDVSGAMLAAIWKWQFVKGKGDKGQPMGISGKITYYFLSQNGRPIVYSATDSFYAGRRPAVTH